MTGHRLRIFAALVTFTAVVAFGRGVDATVPRRDRTVAPTRQAADRPGLLLLQQSTTVAENGDFFLLFDVADDVGDGSDFAVDLYPRIEDTQDLADAVAGRPRNALVTFNPVAVGPPTAGSPRSAGVVLNLSRPASPVSFPLDEPGVYPVRVRLRRSDPRPDEAFYTYLVRNPPALSNVEPMPVALIAKLHHPTPERGDVSIGTGDSRRITAVLDALSAVPDLPISLALTPETAQAVVDRGGSLQAAVAGALEGDHRELLGSPYVEVDPTDLTAAGLVDEIARQASLGNDVLTRAFEAPATDTWMVPGPVDARTVTALDRVGVRNLVLPSTAVTRPPTSNPSALPGSSEARAVVVAHSDDLGSAAVADPVLSAHQIVGRLAALASVTPGSGATLTIDLGGPQPEAAVTLLGLLADPPALLEPTTVTASLAGGVDRPVDAALASPRPHALGRYPRESRETHALVASYSSMLGPRSSGLHEFDEALAQAASDNLTPGQRVARLSAVAKEVQGRLGTIAVPERDRVTLGTRNARVPLPIRSGFSEPVRVLVETEASDRLGLPTKPIEVLLDGERTVVEVPVRVRAAGDTPLVIRVRTPDGRLLAESRYTVRSTAVSGVGLVLTLGAALFLALWWGRHWVRTRRARL